MGKSVTENITNKTREMLIFNILTSERVVIGKNHTL